MPAGCVCPRLTHTHTACHDVSGGFPTTSGFAIHPQWAVHMVCPPPAPLHLGPFGVDSVGAWPFPRGVAAPAPWPSVDLPWAGVAPLGGVSALMVLRFCAWVFRLVEPEGGRAELGAAPCRAALSCSLPQRPGQTSRHAFPFRAWPSPGPAPAGSPAFRTLRVSVWGLQCPATEMLGRAGRSKT